MTKEEFGNKLWNFVAPKIQEFVRAQDFKEDSIKSFIEELNQESDTFCNLNGFKKEFTFKGTYNNGIFSITPTHIYYKNHLSFLENEI